MSTRKIAATVIGVSFVGGAIAAWMFNPSGGTPDIFLAVIGISGLFLVWEGVEKEK
jgi:hypothetical protein